MRQRMERLQRVYQRSLQAIELILHEELLDEMQGQGLVFLRTAA